MYVFKVDSIVSSSMLALAELLAQEHPRWGTSFLVAPCYVLCSCFAASHCFSSSLYLRSVIFKYVPRNEVEIFSMLSSFRRLQELLTCLEQSERSLGPTSEQQGKGEITLVCTGREVFTLVPPLSKGFYMPFRDVSKNCVGLSLNY